MDDENRFLVSDSIKDDIEITQSADPAESMIPILALFPTQENEGIITILRSVEMSLGKSADSISFAFSTNIIDALNIFSRLESGQRKPFDVAIIEHNNKTRRIDLNTFDTEDIKIKDIDSEKQTAVCEVLLCRKNS